ncbi:hypothetical protein N7533_010187 [Penicillium manginii]|uniref:uncharacterized protein n=1 Tax=Penicillium manginii TaxID=203109 RepID=UPI00254939AC|nr:uncharacterized protein N7533_010187 [Penicillium manginii]KAJ5743085.1 hypothetical protein N7533_010187 [Penicillium manginii]
MTEISKKPQSVLDGDCPEKDIQVGTVTDLDEGELFLHQHGFSQENLQEMLEDEPRNKALVRRVDLILLPLLAGTYTLQYIDKSALAYSAVFDLLTSTNMSSNEYSWLASIFYFAYLVAEYPWNLLAQRTRLGKVVSGNIVAWGSMLMITAACSSFTGMAICRFLLGIFEAPITPCFMMIVGMWYTRAQQPFRAGVFYSCNGVGAMIEPYTSSSVESRFAGGVLMLFFLPDDIISAKRFKLDEKALLIARSRLGRTGVINHHIKWYQIREALVDPQVWILFFFTLLNETINGGYANFGKLIIKGLTKDPLTTVALGIPQGAFQVFWILTGTFLASRVRNLRTIVMAIYLLPTIIGVCLMWKLDHDSHKIGILFSYYIIGAYVCSLVLALQMPATNLGGYTKRSTGVALVFLAYCAGNIIGPPCIPRQRGSSVSNWLQGDFGLDAASENEGAAGVAVDELADLTDFENPNFRYVL